MGTGYVRQDVSNNIAAGNVINAADFDDEFDAIVDAFHESTGHTHDGTTAEGAPITVLGPAQDFVGGASAFNPKTDSAYELGTTALRWSTGYIDDLVLTNALPVTYGGTGATSASAARTNLGLVIGTDVQAYDDGLDSIAGLTTSANKMLYATGPDSYAITDLTVFARSLLDDANASTARTTLGVAIGSDVQAYDAALASIAGLTTSANKMIYTTGSDTYAVTDLSAFARTILDDADASAVRTTISAQASDAGLTSIAGLTTAANKMIYTTASDTYAVTDLTSFGRSLLDDANASAARTTLGLGSIAVYDVDDIDADVEIDRATTDATLIINARRDGSDYYNAGVEFGSPRSDTTDGNVVTGSGMVSVVGSSTQTLRSMFIATRTAGASVADNESTIRSYNGLVLELCGNSPNAMRVWNDGAERVRMGGDGAEPAMIVGNNEGAIDDLDAITSGSSASMMMVGHSVPASVSWTAAFDTEFLLSRDGGLGLTLLTDSGSSAEIRFGDEDDENVGRIEYDHTQDQMDFYAGDDLIMSAKSFVSGGNGLDLNGNNIVDTGRIFPLVDDNNDIGTSARRYDDIYATNGTIQTSDEREKQDIAELNAAEMRVATKLKGLIRTFRWKSSVEEKGDDARIHSGVIVQDVIAAFESEGLDPYRYAMIIADHDNPETPMGVRYNELLSFVIAAL